MRKATAVLLAIGALAIPATAAAQPGEGPGNGGGQSEQCKGPQADRPSSCTSQGGPGDRGSN
jgi:hypothetical protein